MKRYQRWAAGFLALVLVLCVLCAGIVYAVDPLLYYRMPEKWKPVFFSERYQAAGLVKHVEADTVLLGSSMVANIRSSWAAEAYGGSALRLTIPDGYFSEFSQVLDLLFRSQTPKRVVFALDLNILSRSEDGVTGAMPGYLYDQNPFNDFQYLLNKDSLYYSLYVLLENRWGGGETVDEGFIWHDGTVWGRSETLLLYKRPLLAEAPVDSGAYLENTEANLAVMKGWFQAHPDTEFQVYLSPYSILFWDRAIRLGELDARLAALERACEVLTDCENAVLYAPLLDRDLITDLDNYGDYIHHSGEAGRRILARIAAGDYRLTAENIPGALTDWRNFVVNYDYEALWDKAFWERWYELHDAPPDWYAAERKGAG